MFKNYVQLHIDAEKNFCILVLILHTTVNKTTLSKLFDGVSEMDGIPLRRSNIFLIYPRFEAIFLSVCPPFFFLCQAMYLLK